MRGFRVILYLSLILDWVGVLLVPTYLPGIPWYNLPVSMLLLAFLSSGSIVVTHELIHQGSFDKFFGMAVSYMQELSIRSRTFTCTFPASI